MVKKVGEKETPLGEKDTPLGEKVTKVGEKVNFVGEKKIHALRVHVVKQTFWPIEGVTMGSHHSSALLGLLVQASQGVQHAAISCQGPRACVDQLRYTPLDWVQLVRKSNLVPGLHILTYPRSKLGGQDL